MKDGGILNNKHFIFCHFARIDIDSFTKNNCLLSTYLVENTAVSLNVQTFRTRNIGNFYKVFDLHFLESAFSETRPFPISEFLILSHLPGMIWDNWLDCLVGFCLGGKFYQIIRYLSEYKYSSSFDRCSWDIFTQLELTRKYFTHNKCVLQAIL